jgi:hypothetical protein
MVTKKQALDKFITEFQNFLTITALPGSILTSREIKLWVKGLDANHPLKMSYNRYVELCGHNSRQKWELNDFDRVANYMKYIPGYERQLAYVKRVNTGPGTRFVHVYRNIIKL